MKELTRNEMAIVKRTAKSTKQLRDKKAKLASKIAELEKELESVEGSIEIFEAPIKHLTGGFTSEEVLNGTMDVNESMQDVSNVEIGDTDIESIKVPAEEAVMIDPNVQSPLAEEPVWNPNDSGECGTDTTAAPFMN